MSQMVNHRTSPWPIQEEPSIGKVYFIPDHCHIPASSVIHSQKQQRGFFLHPILVVHVDKTLNHAHFYSLTKAPPKAIREIGMCFKIGHFPSDDGEGVLKLGAGSECMQFVTWINLDQRFFIEWHYLDYWKSNVKISLCQFDKLHKKVQELEAQQNRYIYKPLLRDLSVVKPGTVLMLLNPQQGRFNTVGAPVLILGKSGDKLRFLRIKEVHENHDLSNNKHPDQIPNPRTISLKNSKSANQSHNRPTVLYLEDDCPSMREASYLEVSNTPKWAVLAKFKTWCYPHICVQESSMDVLWKYMAKHAESETATMQSPTFHERTPLSRIDGNIQTMPTHQACAASFTPSYLLHPYTLQQHVYQQFIYHHSMQQHYGYSSYPQPVFMESSAYYHTQSTQWQQPHQYGINGMSISTQQYNQTTAIAYSKTSAGSMNPWPPTGDNTADPTPTIELPDCQTLSPSGQEMYRGLDM